MKRGEGCVVCMAEDVFPIPYLLTNGEVTPADAARIIGKSDRTARRVLQQLVDNREVVATGAKRNRKYKVLFVASSP
jgi:predicted HTH transcriptional regulator